LGCIDKKATYKRQSTKDTSKDITADKPPKRSKPKPNPDIKTFIDAFYDRFQKKTGKKYHVEGAKDATAVKRLLGTYSLNDLTAHMETFFTADDDWTKNKAGYTIGTFASQVNKIVGGQYGKHRKDSAANYEAAKERGGDKFAGR